MQDLGKIPKKLVAGPALDLEEVYMRTLNLIYLPNTSANPGYRSMTMSLKMRSKDPDDIMKDSLIKTAKKKVKAKSKK